ncbi:MAG: hypothetical protein DWQ37_06995 [Planctomycetota bacterium]|nr:MAG: hypothetical protein DWQ37_06995 [Planctomycetota bacterium]
MKRLTKAAVALAVVGCFTCATPVVKAATPGVAATYRSTGTGLAVTPVRGYYGYGYGYRSYYRPYARGFDYRYGYRPYYRGYNAFRPYYGYYGRVPYYGAGSTFSYPFGGYRYPIYTPRYYGYGYRW